MPKLMPIADAIVSAITKHLSGLEKLTICDLSDVPHSILTQLKELPSLYQLRLWGMNAANLKGVIGQLSLFSNLRRIQLICDYLSDVKTENYRRPLLNLTKYLPNLEELKLSDVLINEMILVDLVSSAQQLKVLYVWYNGLKCSDVVIVKLVKVLKCYKHESDEALQLYLGYSDFPNLKATKNPKYERYLKLKEANPAYKPAFYYN